MIREYEFFIPSNFSLQACINEHSSSHIHGFKEEKLLYILDMLSEIHSINKDISSEDGYVPVNAAVLRKMIGRHYHYYLQYLIDANVIQCKAGFSRISHKSRTYSFTPTYQTPLMDVLTPISKVLSKKLSKHTNRYNVTSNNDQPTTIITCGDLIISNDMKELVKAKLPTKSSALSNEDFMVFDHIMRQEHPYAYKWWGMQCLKINTNAAHSFNEQVFNLKNNYPMLRDKAYSTQRRKVYIKNPYSQYVAGYQNIEKIKNNSSSYHFDPNIFRFHNPLTKIKSELRNCITWNNEPLGAVDISSSQPSLLTALLNEGFWTGENEFSIYSIPYDIIPDQALLSTLITLCKFIKEKSSEDVCLYRDLIESGNFKNKFRDLTFDKTGIIYHGDDIKPVIFQVLYTSNRFIGQNDAAPKRAFKEIFPTIYELIRLIKIRHTEALPILLQRIESHLMFHKILPRIDKECPTLPIFTIHDSVVTLKDKKDYVESIMHQEIRNAIGINPHFKHENWELQKLEVSIQQLQNRVMTIPIIKLSEVA